MGNMQEKIATGGDRRILKVTCRLRKAAAAASLVGLGLLLSFCFLLAWIEIYPEGQDPKNIGYVLWTHGLNQNMNLDNAVAAMTHDRWPLRVVKGLSKEQLKSRFGYIRSLEEAPQHKGCYPATGELGTWADRKEVAFLRDSAWMVILDQGRVVDLVLCKGY
jgi:hypothetical protein